LLSRPVYNPKFELFKKAIIGKKVGVLGVGVSNLPVIELLNNLGAIVYAFDKKEEKDFDEKALEILHSNTKGGCVLGKGYLDNLNDVDIIIKTPGIRPDIPELVKAEENDVVVTSEMEIFMSLCPCKMIGVTGSDGKTTTTTLIYEMLKKDGKTCHVGGNIGTPLLDRLPYINEDDYVVLELSSFQLQLIGISPDISVITNITPNHLDYHKDMDEYTMAKANIFKFQNKTSKLVINADNPVTNSFAGKQKGELLYFSRKQEKNGAYLSENKLCFNGDVVMTREDIKIRGIHNVENYLAAIAALYGIVDKKSMLKVAREFGGVAHRMEFVRSLNGVEFYNDSIGSSPTRTIAGLKAHDGKIVLMAGGYDKKLSFDELGTVVKDTVTSLVLCGATADSIEQSVKKAYLKGEQPLNILKTTDFEQAVKGAYALAKSIVMQGTKERVSVILSPACASFDMFKNFEVRGNTFKDIVNSLE